MIKPKTQQGFLLISIIVIITIIAFFAAAIVYMFTANIDSNIKYRATKQALYAAHSGLEQTTYQLFDPTIDNRLVCNSSLSQNYVYPNLGTAQATATAPYYPTTTLRQNLAAGATTILLTSSGNFAPSGRIMVDREIISYHAINGNNLIGAKRGQAGTLDTAHANGAPVGQYQCNITVTGYVPNSTTIHGKREINTHIQLPEGWLIGGLWNSSTRPFARWNYYQNQANWSYPSSMPSSGIKPNAIDMLNYADGWVVGDEDTTNNIFSIWRWAPTSNNWAKIPTATFLPSGISAPYLQDLNGVSAIASNDAWAVGNRSTISPYRYTILHWNGSSWCLLESTANTCSSATVPTDNANNQNLRAVSVIQDSSGYFGFAVGTSNKILKFNGANWIELTSSEQPTLSYTWSLNDIQVLARNNAWAVGGRFGGLFSPKGIILHWNGTAWSKINPTGSSNIYRRLRAIDMLNANYGWIVGSLGVALRYENGSWTRHFPGGLISLDTVKVFAQNDVWAAGDLGFPGLYFWKIAHWNGSSWDERSYGLATAWEPYLKMAGITTSEPQSHWHETVN